MVKRHERGDARAGSAQEMGTGTHWESRSAAAPATWGVAMEVPVSCTYKPPSPVDSTFTPGAMM
jgi:hypothetical protein